MIKTFAHKGLDGFFSRSLKKGINPQQADRIRRILDRLDGAMAAVDMSLPGYHFHELAGDRKGTYSVKVSGNWRITFRFEGGNAFDVDLEDYH